ncbi:alpha-ketoglutarate-dependent dioxygenase AlkB family protein [Lusitaniella coriacea]|uniref:alpha-ketoglutarate-dependent dioxygenase AlkB family protein n=1 Tax=Lusitaniella coriacea TaxID=1983105 RepID=UPI003CF62B2B
MYEQIELWRDRAENTKQSGKVILSTDGEVILYENFFTAKESDRLFNNLHSHIQWQQDTIQMFGKSIPLPRLTAWYGDEGKSYNYSGIKQYPKPWIPELSLIKNRIEQVVKVKFNSVLLNLYRNGKDGMDWHSDDEPELGKNPIIGSVSLGGTRRFLLKHKKMKVQKVETELSHGSLLLMCGETQHHWQHRVPKTAKTVEPRINLTFRIIH